MKEGQTRKHLRISFLIDVQGITIFTFLIIRLKCIILHSKIYIYCLFSWGFPPKEMFFHFKVSILKVMEIFWKLLERFRNPQTKGKNMLQANLPTLYGNICYVLLRKLVKYFSS